MKDRGSLDFRFWSLDFGLGVSAHLKSKVATPKPVFTILLAFGLAGCISISSMEQPETPSPSPSVENASPLETASPVTTSSSPSLPELTENRELLEESWLIYQQQFIQQDGRVIDYEASDRSTSEGQGYAMLRSVLIDDPTSFALTLDWAEKNLHRRSPKGELTDRLWSWKWGKDKAGKWGPIDKNFASDADIDAITALILASRRWNRPEYLVLARAKLKDLWDFSTIAVTGGKRYLLPGPVEAFASSASTVYLNPA